MTRTREGDLLEQVDVIDKRVVFRRLECIEIITRYHIALLPIPDPSAAVISFDRCSFYWYPLGKPPDEC